MYILGGHVDLWGFKANFVSSWHFVEFVWVLIRTDFYRNNRWFYTIRLSHHRWRSCFVKFSKKWDSLYWRAKNGHKTAPRDRENQWIFNPPKPYLSTCQKSASNPQKSSWTESKYKKENVFFLQKKTDENFNKKFIRQKLKFYFSIALHAQVAVVTKAKLDEVSVKGDCKCD